MKVGIPGLGLAVAEPMAVDAISFQQGGKPGLPSPVTIRYICFRPHLVVERDALTTTWIPDLFGMVVESKYHFVPVEYFYHSVQPWVLNRPLAFVRYWIEL